MELNAKRKQEFQQKMLECINSVISIDLLYNTIYINSIFIIVYIKFFKFSFLKDLD